MGVLSSGRKEGEGKERRRKGGKGEKKNGRVWFWSLGVGGTERLLMGALSHFGKRAAGSPDAVVGLSRLGKCVLQEKTNTLTQFRG
jgi:hypothetical protein